MQSGMNAHRYRWSLWEVTTAAVLAVTIGFLVWMLTTPQAARAQSEGTLYIPLVSGNQSIRPVTDGEVIPGQYVVVFHDVQTAGMLPAGMSVAQMAQTLTESHGGRILYTYEAALSGFAAQLSPEAAARVEADPLVALVEPDRVIKLETTQVNPTWGLDRIDQRLLPLSRSYSYNGDGTGVHAYIVDTGVRVTHQEFTGRIGNGFTAINDGNGVGDCNGHGTHVAGTVGGTTYGVAKGVTLHPVRVLNCQGSGSSSTVIAGIDWVTRNHQKPAVANLSLGGGASSSLDTAVRNSIAAGVTFVVAAGNSNANACNFSPARVGEVLTVGATTSSDARASFSNFGACLDLFAPGSGIRSATHSTNTSAANYSGTSMAAPHVAGAVALYLSSSQLASPAQVHAAVVSAATLDRVGNPGSGSPNRLLYTLAMEGVQLPESSPTATAVPPTATPTATAVPPTATPTATAVPPTATPPATAVAPTATPTATAVPPTATPPASGCTELIANGDFEAAASGWAQNSSQGFPLICNGGVCGNGLSPYRGDGLAWLGGSNRERSWLSQTITIPANRRAILTYWMRIESEDVCRYDYASINVRVGSSLRTIQRLSLCNATVTNGWIQQSIDLSNYAGRQLRLDFQVVTDAWNVSSLFLDDVSMLIGDSCNASAAAAGGPQVVPLQPLDEEVTDDASMLMPDSEPDRPFAAPVGAVDRRR